MTKTGHDIAVGVITVWGGLFTCDSLSKEGKLWWGTGWGKHDGGNITEGTGRGNRAGEHDWGNMTEGKDNTSGFLL